jgi:hypothetical protein
LVLSAAGSLCWLRSCAFWLVLSFSWLSISRLSPSWESSSPIRVQEVPKLWKRLLGD